MDQLKKDAAQQETAELRTLMLDRDADRAPEMSSAEDDLLDDDNPSQERLKI